jgi:hypothetical protein
MLLVLFTIVVGLAFGWQAALVFLLGVFLIRWLA